MSPSSYLKRNVLAVQEFTLLMARSTANAFSRPRYLVDTLVQMDVIGVRALFVVVMTGFFIGGSLALQTYRTLSTFGETVLIAEVVAIAVVREFGPVVTALMVAGRSSSGIASEIGSMLVSEQVDAMRALGTDPLRKLVTPRLFATLGMLPLLTILADFSGMLGGLFVSIHTVHITWDTYWHTAYQSLTLEDVAQGLLKPFFFAIVISLVGCYKGLTTRGGTEGVGRSTTQAVVVASILIIALDFFITKFLIGIRFF